MVLFSPLKLIFAVKAYRESKPNAHSISPMTRLYEKIETAKPQLLSSKGYSLNE